MSAKATTEMPTAASRAVQVAEPEGGQGEGGQAGGERADNVDATIGQVEDGNDERRADDRDQARPERAAETARTATMTAIVPAPIASAHSLAWSRPETSVCAARRPCRCHSPEKPSSRESCVAITVSAMPAR